MQVHSQNWIIKHSALVPWVRQRWHVWFWTLCWVIRGVKCQQCAFSSSIFKQLHTHHIVHCYGCLGQKKHLFIPEASVWWCKLAVGSSRWYLCGRGRSKLFPWMRCWLQGTEVLLRCSCQICVTHIWKVYGEHAYLCKDTFITHAHVINQL